MTVFTSCQGQTNRLVSPQMMFNVSKSNSGKLKVYGKWLRVSVLTKLLSRAVIGLGLLSSTLFIATNADAQANCARIGNQGSPRRAFNSRVEAWDMQVTEQD